MANIRLIEGTADNQVLGVENPTENNAAANKNYVDFIAPFNLSQDSKTIFDQPSTIPSDVTTVVLEGEVGNTRLSNSIVITTFGTTGTITFGDDDLGFAEDALSSTGYGTDNRVFIRARRDNFPESLVLEMDRVDTATDPITANTPYPVVGFYRRTPFSDPTNNVRVEDVSTGGVGAWVVTEVVNVALSNAELEAAMNNSGGGGDLPNWRWGEADTVANIYREYAPGDSVYVPIDINASKPTHPTSGETIPDIPVYALGRIWNVTTRVPSGLTRTANVSSPPQLFGTGESGAGDWISTGALDFFTEGRTDPVTSIDRIGLNDVLGNNFINGVYIPQPATPDDPINGKIAARDQVIRDIQTGVSYTYRLSDPSDASSRIGWIEATDFPEYRFIELETVEYQIPGQQWAGQLAHASINTILRSGATVSTDGFTGSLTFDPTIVGIQTFADDLFHQDVATFGDGGDIHFGVRRPHIAEIIIASVQANQVVHELVDPTDSTSGMQVSLERPSSFTLTFPQASVDDLGNLNLNITLNSPTGTPQTINIDQTFTTGTPTVTSSTGVDSVIEVLVPLLEAAFTTGTVIVTHNNNTITLTSVARGTGNSFVVNNAEYVSPTGLFSVTTSTVTAGGPRPIPIGGWSLYRDGQTTIQNNINTGELPNNSPVEVYEFVDYSRPISQKQDRLISFPGTPEDAIDRNPGDLAEVLPFLIDQGAYFRQSDGTRITDGTLFVDTNTNHLYRYNGTDNIWVETGSGVDEFRELDDVAVSGLPTRPVAFTNAFAPANLVRGHYRSDIDPTTGDNVELVMSDPTNAISGLVAEDQIIGFASTSTNFDVQGSFRVQNIRHSTSQGGQTTVTGDAVIGATTFFRGTGGFVNGPTFNFPDNWAALRNIFITTPGADDQVLVYDVASDQVQGIPLTKDTDETTGFTIPTVDYVLAHTGELSRGFILSDTVSHTVRFGGVVVNRGEAYFYTGSDPLTLYRSGTDPLPADAPTGAVAFTADRTNDSGERVFIHLTDTGVNIEDQFVIPETSTTGITVADGAAINPVFFAAEGTIYTDDLFVELNGIALLPFDDNLMPDENNTITIGGVTIHPDNYGRYRTTTVLGATAIEVLGRFRVDECFTVRGTIREVSAPELVESFNDLSDVNFPTLPNQYATYNINTRDLDFRSLPSNPANTDTRAVQEFHSGIDLVRDVVPAGSRWADVSPFPYRFHITRQFAAFWNETNFNGNALPNYFDDLSSVQGTVTNPNQNRFGNTTAFPNHLAYTGSRFTVPGLTRIVTPGVHGLRFPIIGFDFDFKYFPSGNTWDFAMMTVGPLSVRAGYLRGIYFTAPATSSSTSTSPRRDYLSYERGGFSAADTVGRNIRTGRTDTGIPLRFIMTNDMFSTTTNQDFDGTTATFTIQINISANGVPYPTTDPNNPINATGNHFPTITVTQDEFNRTDRIQITRGANSSGQYTLSGYENSNTLRNFVPTYEMYVETVNNNRMLTIHHLNGPRVGLEVTYTDSIYHTALVNTTIPSHTNQTFIHGGNFSTDNNGLNEMLMVFSQDGAGGLNVQTILNGTYNPPVSLGYQAQAVDIMSGFQEPVFNNAEIFNMGHLQIYQYTRTEDFQHYEVTQMYNHKENWLGAFGEPGFNTARYKINRLLDMQGNIIDGANEVEVAAEIVVDPTATDGFRWRFTQVTTPTIEVSNVDATQSPVTELTVTFTPTTFRPGLDTSDYTVAMSNTTDPTRDQNIVVTNVTSVSDEDLANNGRYIVTLTIESTPVIAGDVITVDYQEEAIDEVTVTANP